MRSSAWSRFWYQIPFILLVFGFLLASAKAYLIIQTTLTGYKIGKLKEKESELLEQQSYLKMELAKATRRESLVDLISKQTPSLPEAWAGH